MLAVTIERLGDSNAEIVAALGTRSGNISGHGGGHISKWPGRVNRGMDLADSLLLPRISPLLLAKSGFASLLNNTFATAMSVISLIANEVGNESYGVINLGCSNGVCCCGISPGAASKNTTRRRAYLQHAGKRPERSRFSAKYARPRLPRGKNVSMEYRFAGGKPERIEEVAAELARLNPDVILAIGGDVVPAAQKATKTIPIVIWVSNDPVQSGIVASLAHPGGNTTGITLILDELAGKDWSY